jgi:CelD/BcsL family acetyltransferase involved in cellulose biosynthesis
VLELAAVDAEDRGVQRLLAELRRRNCAVDCRPGPHCWVIDLPANWEEYLARLSKSHRKKLKRLERSGLSETGTRVCRAADAETVRTGMQILVDLHQRRRRALGDPGCFASPPFSRFLHDAAAALAAANRLNLYWLESEGRPLAAEFQLLGKTTVYAYQAGMDPERLDRQPGRLSCIVGIQQALAAGRTRFDFLRGDEPYKAQWGAASRPSLRVRVAAPKPLAWARHVTWLAGRRAKQAIKDGLAALRAAPAAGRGQGRRDRPQADTERGHPAKGDVARRGPAAASEPGRGR